MPSRPTADCFASLTGRIAAVSHRRSRPALVKMWPPCRIAGPLVYSARDRMPYAGKPVRP
jgi:hypothetical protein